MAGKSANPAYPDAHPTAPGGMSRKALVDELVEKHDYEPMTKADWDAVPWPELIDLVVTERLAREADATPMSGEAAMAFTDVDADDFDDLLAEFEADETVDVTRDYTLDREGYDHDNGTEADAIMEAADGATVGEVEEILYDAGLNDDGVLDPELMFAEMVQARAQHEATQPPPLFIALPGVRDYIFDGHAGAGPSGAERWMNCTMSLTASREFLETLSPNQQAQFAGANSAARQGTTAHAAAEVEANLVLGRATQDEVDLTLMELSVLPADEGEAFDDEMAEYITEYVDLIKSYAQERGDDHVFVEQRVEAVIPLTDMHEGEVYVIRGSADCAVMPAKTGAPEAKTLVVGDLKYGNGIDVDVEENPQIRFYALGVLDLMADDEGNLPVDIEEIVYHIIQPRLGGIKTWSESIDDLFKWRDEVAAPALTKALYGAPEGATFAPSELACQFCPARGRCPALTEARVEQAADLFDTIVEAEFADGPGAFPETTSLTDTRLGELLTMVAGLQNIYSDLREEAQRRLHRGGSVPGYQLVSYTPPRKWTEGADQALAGVAQVWKEPTMMTPTQALKALKGDENALALAESVIVAPPKRPIIAPEGDRRKTWEGTPPEQMFADESGTETGDNDE